MGYYNTFVVKIWCDYTGEMLRGNIQHVSTQERSYFLSLPDMTDFIVKHLSPSPNGSVLQNKTRDGLRLLAEDFGDIGQDE